MKHKHPIKAHSHHPRSGRKSRLHWLPGFVRVQEAVDPSGGGTARHFHHYVQAGFVTGGILTVELDPVNCFDIQPGDFFSIAVKQPHIIAVRHINEARSIDLRFNGRALVLPELSQDIPGACEFREWMRHSYVLKGRAARHVEQNLRDMLALSAAPNDGRLFLLRMKLLQLAGHITRQASQRFAVTEIDISSEAVQMALEYIHANFTRPMNLRNIADASHLSVAYLSRLFQKFIGTSPKQYVINHRIEAAKQMLLINNRRLPIKAISSQAGFASHEQFTRTFWRLIGCAPRDFAIHPDKLRPDASRRSPSPRR